MNNLTLGPGTRLQHTQYGPGVIVALRYATYIISFINHGVKEIDKTDDKLEEIIPENVSAEIETHSEVERSLLKILRLWKMCRWEKNGRRVLCCCSLLIKH